MNPPGPLVPGHATPQPNTRTRHPGRKPIVPPARPPRKYPPDRPQPGTATERASHIANDRSDLLPAEEVSWLEFVAAQGFLDAMDVGWGSGAMVDGEGLP
jgi:hypothetical protein